MSNSCCHKEKKKFDYIFWGSLSISLIAYVFHLINPEILHNMPRLVDFNATVFEILNKMWWGLLIGIFFVGIIGLVPKEVVTSILGHKKGIKSIFRATVAGVVLDLCSHGILLVAMKLYERGARLSQVLAFLIASPWNSLSLTVILIALLGWKWTIIYILLSMLIALVSGLVAEYLVGKKLLPENPHKIELEEDFSIKASLKEEFKGKKFTDVITFGLLIKTFKESEMILRWIFLGVVLAGVIRAFIPTEIFTQYFGPTLIGLFLTLIAATIIEVCSEGSVPIAYDLFTRAAAQGNAFLFLMTGVSTDYTEIMSLKETTKSWKVALFLPIVTVPQILVISYALNNLPK